MSEASDAFACFGGTCAVHVTGDAPHATAREAVAAARRSLLSWHDRFTRFRTDSELSRLNANPSAQVEVSAIMARFVQAVVDAARATDGLVDATLLGALERAGYAADLRAPLPLAVALRLAAPRRPASGSPASRWSEIHVDRAARVVTRPPGVAIDSGGIAKGLLADVLAQTLRRHEAFAIDCAGDLRIGGAAGVAREVRVAGPLGAEAIHALQLADAGVATSGISRRAWLDERGRPAHHLLDPSTGRPAFTGIVQVTATAPTALEAEIRAKAALLSGPDGAGDWLPDGGVLVLDSGDHVVVEPARRAARAPARALAPAPA